MNEVQQSEMQPKTTIRLVWQDKEGSPVFDTGKLPLEEE